MLLKNLVLYRLGPRWNAKPEALEKKLAKRALQPCGSFEMESRGWLPPRGDLVEGDEPLVYTLNHHWLLTLGVERKLLPTSVVRQFARERAAQVAAQQAWPVGRKQMRDITDQVTTELMPKALARRSSTRAWIDSRGHWLAVDAAADKGAEEFLDALRHADDDLPCKRLDTKRSPGTAMTQWLAKGEAPGAFTIDQDLELIAPDVGKATVRYTRHALDGKDIRDHVSAGKTVTRMGLTWKDRISFVLTDKLFVKRIHFLDIVNEDATPEPVEEEEKFDIDFALMTGELSLMLTDLVKALGGESESDD
jgi:recombination associated protein RdgC